MSKKVAFVDMDFCIVDWSSGMLPELLKLESPDEVGKYDYSDCWKLEKQYPHIGNRIKLVMSKRGFWRNLKPIDAGLELYKYIAGRFDTTYILTKTLKYCDLVYTEKVEWIHKYIGLDANMMLVTDKKCVVGDLLFDDAIENLDDFLKINPNGKVIMPIRKHNESVMLRSDLNPKSVYMWNDSPTKQYISGEIKLDYDFSIPHKAINEALTG